MTARLLQMIKMSVALGYWCLLLGVAPVTILPAVSGDIRMGQAHPDAVLELDNSFLERRGDKAWLVMFYAPWCGHCKRLEPVWQQVKSALKGSEVHVAKVDATRYSQVASEYVVRGYPTILYIQGERVVTYRGDRVRDSIVTFVNRASGPAVRWLSNVVKFNEAKSDHSSEAVFVYVGIQSELVDVMKKYAAVADDYRVYSYFYAVQRNVLPPKDYTLKHDPTVIVLKDGKYFEYDPPEGVATKSTLDDFVNGERFVAFPMISAGGLNEMAGLNKNVVIFVTRTKVDDDPVQDRVKALGRMLASNFRDKYHSLYQMAWMSEPETANTIIMSRPETPYMLVLEPQSQRYYLPDDSLQMSRVTIDDLHSFLETVMEGKAVAYGGTGFWERIKRMFYDIWITIAGIYNESPWLALLVFGVPSMVVSIVCYALCCMEAVDEDAFYDELAEEAREAALEEEGITDAEGQDVLLDDNQVRRRNIGSADDSSDDSHIKSE